MKKYTSKEMAELLGISVQTLWRWDKSGKFKAYRYVDGGNLYYTQEHFDLLKNKNNVIVGDNDGK